MKLKNKIKNKNKFYSIRI